MSMMSLRRTNAHFLSWWISAWVKGPIKRYKNLSFLAFQRSIFSIFSPKRGHFPTCFWYSSDPRCSNSDLKKRFQLLSGLLRRREKYRMSYSNLCRWQSSKLVSTSTSQDERESSWSFPPTDLTACRSSEKVCISWGKVFKKIASKSLKTCVYTGCTAVSIFWTTSLTRSLLQTGSMTVDALISEHGDNHHHHHLWESGSTWHLLIASMSMVLYRSMCSSAFILLALMVSTSRLAFSLGLDLFLFLMAYWPPSFFTEDFTPVSSFLRFHNEFQNCRSRKYTILHIISAELTWPGR